MISTNSLFHNLPLQNHQNIQKPILNDKTLSSITKQISLLKPIIQDKYQHNSASVKKLIFNQFRQLFQLTSRPFNQPQFIDILTQKMYQIYVQNKTNYHKFLVGSPVLALSYQAKIFLLYVFKQYDETLYYQKKIKNFSLNKFSLNKKNPWSEANKLNQFEQIMKFQKKMYQIYKGQFLNIYNNFSYITKENSEKEKEDILQNIVKRNFNQVNQKQDNQIYLSQVYLRKKIKKDYHSLEKPQIPI